MLAHSAAFHAMQPELRQVVACAWNAYCDGHQHAPGPVGLVFKAVETLGWTWVSVDGFRRPGRSDLPLCGGPDTWWDHELRAGLRLVRWAEAARKRNDMKGLDAIQGVDRVASLAVLQRATGHKLGLLRAILAGSVRLQRRLFEASIVDSPICPFCGMADETIGHCFWDCAHWDSIRVQHRMADCRSRVSWPMCTQECGLFLEDERLPGLAQQLLDEETILTDIHGHFGVSACREAIITNDVMDKQVAWTDGASARNQDARFRRAGSGIFYGPDHALNFSAFLPGLAQSNQCAELFAVLVACLRDPRPLEIRTDSEWVCNGFSSWRSWFAYGWQGEHADLWDMLACELSSRVCDVHVSWVKGHATEIDVERGRTTREDKIGNDGADKLAVAGAASHQVLPEVVACAKARRQLAIRTHEMMTAILTERLKQETLQADVTADRGSESGDGPSDTEDHSDTELCTELLDDELDDGEHTLNGVP